jgi:hypothetical protein
VLPLEVVEQRPGVVAVDADAVGHGPRERFDVTAEVRHSVGIVDEAVARDGVVVRGAVLGDHQGDRRPVVPTEPEHELVERVGSDLPAHVRRRQLRFRDSRAKGRSDARARTRP